MKFTQAHMTSGSQSFVIKAIDLMHGQAIRDRNGMAEYVSEIEYVGDRVQFTLISSRGTSAMDLPLAGGYVTTNLPIAGVSQPGMDPESMRCGTCDSRHCGYDCHHPYILDRA